MTADITALCHDTNEGTTARDVSGRKMYRVMYEINDRHVEKVKKMAKTSIKIEIGKELFITLAFLKYCTELGRKN